MKIRVKAKDVEIEYEEPTPETGYFMMTGNDKDGKRYGQLLTAIQTLIDGAEKLLKAK